MNTFSTLRGLAIIAGLSLLSACGGGGGGSAKTDLLTMTGSVIAPSADGATVTVKVGDESFETTADSEGNFEIEIEATDSDALVTVLTKLGSDLSFVELLSNLGSFSDLVEDAGSDTIVTSVENIKTNISSLSTAEAVLIEEAEEEGKSLRKTFTFGDGVDPEEALTLGALIQLAINNPGSFALPQGSATTLELARNATARDAFRDDVEGRAPNDLEQAKQDLVGDVNIVGPARAGDVPPDLLAARLDSRGDFPFNESNLVDGFEFDADGSGRYFNGVASTGMAWALTGAKIVVTFDTAIVGNSAELVDCSGSGVSETRDSQISVGGAEIARLSANAVSVTATATITTPDCPNQPSRNATTTIAKTVLKPETLQTFSASEVAGRGLVLPALSTSDQGGNPQVQSDLLDFAAAGTGSGRFIAPAFGWSVADGALNVDYGNGIQGRYRPVLGIDGTARVILADYTTPNGRFAELGLSFPRDPGVAFNAAQIPGRYFQFGIGTENGGDPRLQGFRLRLDANGQGAQENDFVNPNGEVVDEADPYLLNWTLAGNGELSLDRYYDTRSNGNCNPPASDTCVLFDQRILVPINRSGERYYWLERRRLDDSGVDSGDRQTFIARFYDRVPLTASKAGD